MASAGAIRAGKAFVELFMVDRLGSGMAKVAAKLKAFGATISSIGTRMIGIGSALAAPLLAAARYFATTGGDMMHMSERTGIAVETLSRLAYVAGQTGVEVSALQRSVWLMDKTLSAAQQGNVRANQTLSELGLTYNQLRSMNPEEQFLTILDALSRIPHPAQQAALAMRVFGRSGANLLTMTREGAAGIRALMAESDRLGLTMSTTEAEAAHRFEQRLTSLWATLKRIVFVIGESLAPVLTDAATQLREWAVQITAWIRQNRGLIVSLLKIAATVIGVGIALTALGRVISGVGSIIAGLAGIVRFVTTVLSMLVSAISWLLTPFGLLVAMIGVATAAWLMWSESGQRAMRSVRNGFMAVVDDVMVAKQGIVDALMAGDVGLAARILWLTVKLEAMRAWLAIKQGWWTFTHWLFELWLGMKVIWLQVTNFLADSMIRAIGWIRSAWVTLTNWLRNTYEDTTSWIAARMIDVAEVTGNMTPEDARQSRENLTTQRGEDRNRANRETREAQARITAETNAQREALRQQHEQDMIAVGDRAKAADDELQTRIAAGQAEIDEARRALVAAADEARRRREALAQAREEEPSPTAPRPPAMPPMRHEWMDRVAVRGGFGIHELGMIAAADPVQNRIASAVERTADATEDMADTIEDVSGGTYED